MRIGEVSERSGVPVETVRYYERTGLLPPPARAANNYRHYTGRHLRRLRFVRRCRELGFRLAEVRELLGMVDGGDYRCRDVQAVGLRHLEDVRARLADLRRLEDSLAALVAACEGSDRPDCSFLERLFEDAGGADGKA